MSRDPFPPPCDIWWHCPQPSPNCHLLFELFELPIIFSHKCNQSKKYKGCVIDIFRFPFVITVHYLQFQNWTFQQIPGSTSVFNSVPVTFNATSIIWSGTIVAADVGAKKLIAINKALRAGLLTDYSQAYVGFKTQLEIPFNGATYIGFRCLAPPCATVPFSCVSIFGFFAFFCL